MFADDADQQHIIFQPGETIVAQGEYLRCVYYLAEGSCYRMLTTEKGDEVIYDVKKGGCGMTSLISILSLYADNYGDYSFIAKTRCHCLRISTERFTSWANDKPEVLLELLHMSVALYRNLMATFQSHQEGRVANRLCRLLLTQSELTDGQLLISKCYTNAEMGAFLGIHKVTVSRIIRTLREEGVLEKSPGGLIVTDHDRLLAYAQGEKLLYK